VPKSTANAPALLTIGHSTRPWMDFLALLRAHGIQRLVDVRTIPRSRHNPQFNADVLSKQLRAAKIAYTYLPRLGGLRRARPDSPNMAWRNASFRGFADYMQTPEFAAGLHRLLKLAAHRRSAIMCAEAVPWRCHRSLIADALAARGLRVDHIMSLTRAQPHKLTPFARVRRHHVTYPLAKAAPSRPSRTKSPRPAKSKPKKQPRHS
jgi:uncharacterized protein (DUF488 family)